MNIENLPQHIRNEWDTATLTASDARIVRTFHGIGRKPGGEFICEMSEHEFIKAARLRLEQNNAGRFTPCDVAAILAASQNWDELTQREFLWHLHHDVRRGDIRITKDNHSLERNCAIDGDKHSDSFDLLGRKEISRWLETQNAPYQFLAAPVESANDRPAPHQRGTKWTPERKAVLKAFRDSHTMLETAKQFGISEQRIRKLLPSDKPQKQPYSVFTHHIK